MWVRMPTLRIGTAGAVTCKHKVGNVAVLKIVVEDSHDVLTIEGVSTSISAHTTIVVHNGSIEVVVVEERTFVIDTYTGLCFPPLTGIPGAEGEVGLLVTEWVQSYVVLVTNGTGVTLVAILVCLVRIFRINRRIGIAGTDKYVQTIEQEVEF